MTRLFDYMKKRVELNVILSKAKKLMNSPIYYVFAVLFLQFLVYNSYKFIFVCI